MKNVYLLGECMVELSRAEGGLLKQSYAGDTYNTAVYLKRAFAEFNVHFFTAVGTDPLSDDMLAAFGKEKINTDLVQRARDKTPGLYMIGSNEAGARSVSYWRDNSAAREVMQFCTAENVGQLCMGDLFFFSGISLAMIQPKDREIFWMLLRKLKDTGVRIAFDPNYRVRMWADMGEAKAQLEQAFRMADLVLPGSDDLQQLYGITELNKVREFADAYGIEELVLKNGLSSVICIRGTEVTEMDVTSVEATAVVDTTSAGDSFNGVYLGARMHGFDIPTSVDIAAKAATLVIQHPGAIAPAGVFEAEVRPLIESSDSVSA